MIYSLPRLYDKGLFFVYIHGVAAAMQKSPFGCRIGPVEVGDVLRADVMAIMALSPASFKQL